MLCIDTAELTHTGDLATAVLDLPPCTGAAELRLMLLTNDTFAPQILPWTS